MLHRPIPNDDIARLERSGHDELLGIFGACLKSGSIKTDYARLADAWGMLFSGMYLSAAELVEGMLAGEHRLGEDKEAMLREFIKADCARGGFFTINIIQKGGTIDRAALIMIADLADLAGLKHDGTPAIHLLVTSCDKRVRPTLIRKAGARLLSSVYDRNGMPVLFILFGMGDISRFDLEAIAAVCTKDDLKKTMVQSRMGRNALEVFNEVSSVLGMHAPKDRKTQSARGFGKKGGAAPVPGGAGSPPAPAAMPQPGAAPVRDEAPPDVMSRSPSAIVPPVPEAGPVPAVPASPAPGAVPATVAGGSAPAPDEPAGPGPAPVIPDETPPAQDAAPAGVVGAHVHEYYSRVNSPVPAGLGDTKILVVDDDEIIRSLMQAQLSRLGYTLCTMAGSGDEAIQLAKETRPDFIFMDISMPGNTDGIAAAREIRQHLQSRIIFLSAYSDAEIIDRAGEIHPDGYILKPFSDTDLRVVLELRK